MTTSVLKHQHSSLQFSDPEGQQEHDVRTLFAKGKAYPIKTGTESGTDNPLRGLLEKYARENDHSFHARQGNWVAVDRNIIKKGTVRKSFVHVINNDTLFGKQADREFPTLSFTHEDERMGRFVIAGFHYSTKGRLPRDPNWDTNRLYARKISDWMEKATEKGIIALGAGDFNMVDIIRRQDWAFGENFTSMADELKDWANTGHGPIDGFISYDAEKRVKPKKFQVLEDNQLKMFTDHFVCRGTWTIKHLKGASA